MWEIRKTRRKEEGGESGGRGMEEGQGMGEMESLGEKGDWERREMRD